MSELGSGVNQLGGNQTDEALSGMISSQLSKLLASSLDLDIVEIDANENWENTSFVVGKYIASNLFVIYQRSFGKSTDNEISKQKIILEYELNRHLFFRLESGDERTSGVDLILKKESKK
jgi:autotransporter translocation and assembly factor TamB